ncbi:HTH domain-containing protein [Streptomyces sp. NPDC035033]|uniref:HTH domain-containing protein n=1 Tax=Streptomyces sp. NPDC035033 TaxID=3155368 RepID=UPI0033E3CFEC
MRRAREWLFERVRRTRREQGLSGRELAVRFEVSRSAVRKAPGSSVPPKRKSPPGKGVLESAKGFFRRAPIRPGAESCRCPTTREPLFPRQD